ncbi:MAG: NTE family protein [Comamonadaceae bacterium]|nr:MAG: NTE family protein [Comamonadaceae bacterium]
MQPKASPGNKLLTFDKEGARSDSAPLRGLRAVTRIPAGRMAWAAITLLTLGFLTACAATPDDERPAGHELRDLQAAAHHSDGASRPVLAIALGGGGLRGYAHIGVLQALEDAGIQPNLVVGTSIGAIVGAAYASGVAPAQLWNLATAAPMFSLADLTLTGPGFVKGQALARWTNELVGQQPIERFSKRFAAVASDLQRAMPIAITSGNAGQAARASAAIPGVFLPVKYSDGELVDGGITSLVPVQTARALGADIVIAVDIYCHGARYPSTSVLSAWLRVSQTQSCLLAKAELAGADVVIATPVSPPALNDAAAREQARRLGYAAASEAVPALRAALRRFAGDSEHVNSDASMREVSPVH